MGPYSTYPPHGHPDHDCAEAMRRFAVEHGITEEQVLKLHRVGQRLAQFCTDEGIELNDGDLLGAVIVVRGAAAEEWNRDDPAYLAKLTRQITAQRRRAEAQWN